MVDENQLGIIGLDEEGFPTIKEPVFINISIFKNSSYLNIRKYYDDHGEWKPTKKGIALTASQFEELLEILNSNKENILSKLS